MSMFVFRDTISGDKINCGEWLGQRVGDVTMFVVKCYFAAKLIKYFW